MESPKYLLVNSTIEFNENNSPAVTKLNANICELCGKDFANVYTLSAHIKQVHQGIKAWTCELCQTGFATRYKLQRHHRGVHSDEREFRCLDCNGAYKTRDMLLKHQRTHSGAGPFECVLCSLVFKFKSGLDHHNKLKHQEKDSKPKVTKPNKTFECEFCGKKLVSLAGLQRHESIHKSNECSCGETFDNQQELRQHQKIEHSLAVIFRCVYCLKQYKSKANFEAHIASHEKENEMQDYEYVIEEEKEETYLDEEESEAFNDIGIPTELLKNIDESLVSIVLVKTEESEPDSKEIEEVEELPESEPEAAVMESLEDIAYFNDDEVENYLIERDNGMDFYETIIAEELEPTGLCDDDMIAQDDDYILSDSLAQADSQEFIEESMEAEDVQTVNLKVPRTKVNGQKCVCESCGSTFQNNSHLKRHIQRKHQKESHKFECDQCGKKFLLNYDLRRHMAKHNSIRSFKCEICHQQFKWETTLKNHHKTIHDRLLDQQRTFECQLCDRSYFHQRHLEYHMRRHTGDQRYKCSICVPEKLFFYSEAVKWHEIRFHKKPAPFNCALCSKKFIHERSLQTHEKEHQMGTAVNCPLCGKKVSEKRHLKRHMRGHLAKEFKCLCGDEFKERHQLTK